MKIILSRFIFYSLAALALAVLGYFLRPELSQEFLQNFELWRAPVAASMIGGLGLALLGVFIFLNRIVFMSLAVAQGAGLGMALTFYLGVLLGWHFSHNEAPYLAGIFMAALFSLIFTQLRKKSSLSEEGLLGLLYVVGSGFILLIGDRIPEGKHDLENLLFGNMVAVTSGELLLLSLVILGIFIPLMVFRREFLYSSADPIFMKTRGVSVRFWMGLLFALLTLGISVSLKILGALPVFTLLLLPALIGLHKTPSMRSAVIVALILGVSMPALGYYYSYLFSFPTGATLTLVGLYFLLLNIFETRILLNGPS